MIPTCTYNRITLTDYQLNNQFNESKKAWQKRELKEFSRKNPAPDITKLNAEL